MGEMISFTAGEGETYQGYLAVAGKGRGPGVIVVQEWWGLVGHIKDVVERFAAEGFTALAPDLYEGDSTKEPDEAASMMMALNITKTASIMQKATTLLMAHPSVSSERVGVVGFCMGGQLALFAAASNPGIGACVDFYGIHPNVQPSFRQLEAPVLGIFAEHDEYASPEVVRALDIELRELSKQHEFHTYPGTQHAFFNSDRPEVYNREAAEDAWQKTIAFLREHLPETRA